METWLVIVGVALGVQAHINRRAIMAGIAEVSAAVDAARTELEADKAAIIAEIQRLGLPDADTSALVTKIQGFGSLFDDVPGVTPVPPPDEPPAEDPPADPPVEGFSRR